MLVLIRWQDRNIAVPLSQLKALNPDESTNEAIGDWHYWVSQGYLFEQPLADARGSDGIGAGCEDFQV